MNGNTMCNNDNDDDDTQKATPTNRIQFSGRQ